MESLLGQLPHRDDEARLLHHLFDINHSTDYDDVAETFAHRFFLTNFWKTAAALASADPDPPSMIVDLGCGPGAATAATLAWLWSCDRRPERVEVALVDRSPKQLELARRLVTHAAEQMPGLTVEISSVDAVISPNETAWRTLSSGADLVLASHLLTENLDHASRLIEELRQAMPPLSHLLVVERPDDEIWSRIPSERGAQFQIDTRGLPLDGFLRSRNETRLSVRYALLPARRAKLIALVETYFRAWEEQSVDLLDEVFSSDAIYLDKPFSEPIRSLDGIRDYWIRRVLPQKNPKPHVLRLAIDNDSAVVEWEADLTVDQTHKLVSGVMDLELDSAGDRIGILRECYASRVIP